MAVRGHQERPFNRQIGKKKKHTNTLRTVINTQLLLTCTQSNISADIPYLIYVPHMPGAEDNLPVHKDTKSFCSSRFFFTGISLAPITAISASGDDFATIQSHHTTL